MDKEKDKDKEKVRFLDNEQDEAKKLNQEIVKNAEEMRKLVDEKPMGLPQINADLIREFTDSILLDHSAPIEDADLFGDLDNLSPRPSSSRMSMADVERRGQDIIATARRSKAILGVLKDAKHKTGDDAEVPAPNVGNSYAGQHLEKMVKKLHCRHRKLIRLAEEIIARRWKLSQIAAIKEGKPPKGDGGTKMTAEEFTDKNRRRKKRKARMKRKSKSDKKDLQTLYKNPMATLQEVGKRCLPGAEGWKQEDPLMKLLNKVGVDKVQKCLLQSEEDPTVQFLQSRNKKKKDPEKRIKMAKKSTAFPDPSRPTVEAHMKKSVLSIFVSNYSRMTVVPKETSVAGRIHFRDSLITMKVDRSTLTNNFVDVWKRRSFGVGIILIILTALQQCIYLCGPRMGDNYVTHTMVTAISGMPWAAPTGIYGLIFTGYLLGGMAVIKTAAAVEHNQTVKHYFSKRKKKFYFWYGLATYYFAVWMFRSWKWYSELESQYKEIHAIFQKKFYYNELPGRLLYTQFLIACCGANGPDDYPDGPVIGWPKSCYTRVDKYDDYYKEPRPVNYGCSVRVYKYTTMAMSVMGFLTFLNWLLILIHPIYLYVYELFICIRSKEPDPWLVKVKVK